MSMEELNEGIRIVEANRSRGFFAGPRDPALITAAESALGGTFPPTYRAFLRHLGAGNFGASEFYGVIDDNFEDSEVPNGIWLTLRERTDSKLPKSFAVIGSTGDGSYYCLGLENGQETPVVVLDPGIPAAQQRPEVVAKDFGEFFLNEVRARL